jgi:hypothetical protein
MLVVVTVNLFPITQSYYRKRLVTKTKESLPDKILSITASSCFAYGRSCLRVPLNQEDNARIIQKNDDSKWNDITFADS